MSKEAIIKYLAPLALTALVSLLGWAFVRIAAYFNEKRKGEKEGSARARSFAALAVLSRCAGDAVTRIESTLRPKFGLATEDGKVTSDEAMALLVSARNVAWDQARLAAPEVLAAAGITSLADVFDLLTHLVQSAAAQQAGDSREKLPVPKAPEKLSPPPAPAPA